MNRKKRLLNRVAFATAHYEEAAVNAIICNPSPPDKKGDHLKSIRMSSDTLSLSFYYFLRQKVSLSRLHPKKATPRVSGALYCDD